MFCYFFNGLNRILPKSFTKKTDGTSLKRKKLPRQSEELFQKYCVCDISKLFPTYLSLAGWIWHLVQMNGCQGFTGPFPSAFLDKII